MSFAEALLVTPLVQSRLYEVQTWLRCHWLSKLIITVLKRAGRERIEIIKKIKTEMHLA